MLLLPSDELKLHLLIVCLQAVFLRPDLLGAELFRVILTLNILSSRLVLKSALRPSLGRSRTPDLSPSAKSVLFSSINHLRSLSPRNSNNCTWNKVICLQAGSLKDQIYSPGHLHNTTTGALSDWSEDVGDNYPEKPRKECIAEYGVLSCTLGWRPASLYISAQQVSVEVTEGSSSSLPILQK